MPKAEIADQKIHRNPLDTQEHVSVAASYWGQAKNKAEYSEEDQQKISRRISAAQRKFKIGKESAETK